MARHQQHAAQREAQASAAQAQQIRNELAEQTKLEKDRAARERERAQRVMMRSLRAGSGGYFETDTNSTLGGSGVIG